MKTDRQLQDTSAFNLDTAFTINVSGKPFYLSWKSLISDGPNNFFTRQLIKNKTTRVLHIDRSRDTFEFIARHLRGYPVIAKDEYQQQDMLSDAHYYGLNKLIRSLSQFVYLNIGGTTFRVRWELFDKDGPYNYFTGFLKQSLLSPHTSLGESPPICVERDPEVFKDIIRHLQGYSISIRNEQHRQQLLSDAQFYLLRRLRDKLKCSISTQEMLLYHQDIRSQFFVVEDNVVLYRQDKEMFTLLIQINDTHAQYNQNNKTFMLEQDISLRDPRWSISKQIKVDKDCAIIQQPKKESTLDEFVDSLLSLDEHEKQFSIEKAIAQKRQT
ncbi:uncharacterized protein B0P05DRAFT_583063 [Gilbertella persicaria]|uniref:uncharacterized protein n=1 Tax=Gilbertella persicaria TaxID=101096 RepID=UPI002220A3AB|nr:uncharacterized protein B0P05DRAFT_583063 [Gilbertella persicaria]KAI8098094.1 hypothetical protein B0P05DRAFT_583063 [Gilbertella persicaria]